MNILIITPDSEIGRRIMAELMSPEFKVRVVADDPAIVPEEWREQVEMLVGSVEDTLMLRRALIGVDSVLWCQPLATSQEIERSAHALSRAMQAAGTPRLVTVSTAGCGFVRHADIISGQPGVEDILNESGAAVRHLHHDLLMEYLFSQVQSMMEAGTFSLPMPGDIQAPLVAADDVADVVLRWLVREDWNGNESLAVQGPKRISGHQAAAVLEQVLERPMRYQKTPPKRGLQSFIVPGKLAKGRNRLNEKAVESTAPTTFASWVVKYLLPLMNPEAMTCECEI